MRIGPRCYELRIGAAGKTWRIVYRLDADAVVIVDVFQKTTQETPHRIIVACQRRPQRYDSVANEEE